MSTRRTAFLLPLLLVAASAGCDPGVVAPPVEDIRYTTADAAAPPTWDAGTGVLGPDGGETLLPDGGEPTFPGDAGTVAPDSDVTTTDALDGCTLAACGAAPAEVPTCFDGQVARVQCAPFADGSCTWQFACGL